MGEHKEFLAELKELYEEIKDLEQGVSMDLDTHDVLDETVYMADDIDPVFSRLETRLREILEDHVGKPVDLI